MLTYTVSLYERAGSPHWQARIYIQGEGGRERRYSTGVAIGTHKRQSAREATRVAQQYAERISAEVGQHRAAEESTALRSVADRMLRQKTADGRRDRAVDSLADSLDKHVIPFFRADRDIRTIRRADLEAFKAHLRNPNPPQRPLAPQTINNNLTAIRQVLRHAWAIEEMLESVPMVPNVRTSNESKGRALTVEEFQRLIDHLDPRAKEARDFLVFLANTGTRKSEALAIRWSWIDWQGRAIRIPEEYRKGAQARAAGVPINDVVSELLTRRKASAKQPSLDRVFFQQKHDGARNAAAARAGLGRVRNHDLRHTFGSLAHASGASLPEVRDLLGHKTLAMVSRYAHSYESKLHAVANRVQLGVLSGGKKANGKAE